MQDKELTGNAGRGRRLGHIAELDGLRALAVVLVIFHHIHLRWPTAFSSVSGLAQDGWVGVDIFFVLSGFLITSILLTSDRSLRSLRDFYIKRAARIWPLYYFLLLLVCVDAYHVHQSYPWRPSLVLIQNFLPAFPNLGFNQTWSLCIEEQFYFFWPLLVLFAPRKWLQWIIGAVLLVSPVLREIAIHQGVIPKLLYTATPYRLDAIAMGSAIALAYQRISRQRIGQLGRWVFPPALVATVVLFYLHRSEFWPRSAVAYSLLAVTAGALLCMVLSPNSRFLGAVLRMRGLRWLGSISYGLYLLHPLVFGLASKLRLPSAWEEMALSLCVSVLAAALSWHLVEKRLIRSARRYIETSAQTHRTKPVGAGNIAALIATDRPVDQSPTA
ncbi:MAG TPA: acyltransferase [Acidobacteriaceae bacterium]|nr:acyltransferase [Acidobacteriaceae bacterium]